MRIPRTTGLLLPFAGLLLLTGCVAVGDFGGGGGGAGGAGGAGGGDGDRGHFYPSDAKSRTVEGTVERVDPADRRIVVSEEAEGAEGEPGGREIALYYEDDTVVVHEGQRYRPEDLEPGDRIQAVAEITSEGLSVQQIEVLADVNDGGPPERSLPQEPATPQAPDDQRDRRDQGDRRDRREAPPLSGTVRFVDTRAHTLEIETPSDQGRPELVEVLYDAETIVEYQGSRYSPDKLELGDQVEIDVRPHGGRLLADHIVVVGEGETEDR
jgi:hypothetical protein